MSQAAGSQKANVFVAHNVEHNGTFKSNDFPFNLTFKDLGVGCNFKEMGKHKVPHCMRVCVCIEMQGSKY